MLIALDDPHLVWLLVRTKPKQETAVLHALAARDVPAYCPRILEPRWDLRAPRGPVPLFPSSVFAQCVVKERYAAVRYCSGVSGIVRFGEALAAVEDDFVASLREREGERGYVVIAEARRASSNTCRQRIVCASYSPWSAASATSRWMPGTSASRRAHLPWLTGLTKVPL